MAKTSAGILMYRTSPGGLAVFLVHHGGPFFKHKDLHVWSIPKGAVHENESPFEAAKREFFEETGIVIPEHEALIELGSVRQKSGKITHAWGWESTRNEAFIKSVECRMEWPPRTKRILTFPEVDQGEFFSLAQAKEKIIPEQFALIERLREML